MAIKTTSGAPAKTAKQEKWKTEIRGEPVTVAVDGSFDVRFSLTRSAPLTEEAAAQVKKKVGEFGKWAVSVEVSTDGEKFTSIRPSAKIHPAVMMAATAPEVQALFADGEFEANTGNFVPAEPKAAAPAKVAKKAGKK